MVRFILGRSVRADLTAARSAPALVGAALGWHQVLLFPSQESAA